MSTPPVTSTAAHTPPSEGHDAQGRFTLGNRGGPGNPFARQVAAIRKALLNAVSPEDITAIAQALAAKAKAGDVAAAKVLLSYVVGKPAPAPDPDRLDMEEVDRLRERAFLFKDIKPLFGIPDAGMFLDILREVRPHVTTGFASHLKEGLLRQDKPRGKSGRAAKAPKAGAPSTNGSSESLPPPPAERMETLLSVLAPSANGKSGGH